MWIKIIGACMVVGASSVLGFYISYKEKYRIMDLEEMKRLLCMLAGEIRYAAVPLPQAFSECAKKTGGIVAVMAEDMADALYKKSGGTAGELWRGVLEKYRKETYFTDEDIQSFQAFGRTLGYLDAIQQETQIEAAVAYILQTQKEVRKQYEKTGKIYKSMGVIGGILLAVILF